MSNKELAVQLYSAMLQFSGSIASNPNFTGTARIPSFDEAVEKIKLLTEKLSSIEDK